MRPQTGRTCEQSMLSSYPASIVCLRAKHACRPKYAFGERIHAGTTCLHSCARRAGVGWGLNRKLELRPKRHELIFGGIPSSLVIHPKRKPFSHAFGFGFGKTAVSASELCSVVLITSVDGLMGFPAFPTRLVTSYPTVLLIVNCYLSLLIVGRL